ncbi:isoleucine--tRNA ligase [bacterium]|nr:isoleucine--tRNA ligase [bacterium]
MEDFNLIKSEEKILEYWKRKKIFERSLKKRAPKGNFVFYEGPPTANGKPHIGHALTRAYKDVVLRYRTMAGYRVERKAGWDTQGLPVEIEVEKEIGISGKPDIEEFGIENFNRKCRESVWKYKKEWEKMTQRLGFWIDLVHPYITYEKDYIETIWWIIERIWEKGLLYQDFKVVPYCPRCGTTLSSHEVAQGYKNIEEISVYLKFALKDSKEKYPTYFLVWTTTPWTLPGNVALAINKNVYYVKILKDNKQYILARDRLNVVERPYEIIDEFLGEKILGLKYQPLYEFVQPDKPAYYLIHGDFVSTDDGTGIVHIAPAFGEEDLNVGKENNLPILFTVELDGRISPEIGKWGGLWIKDADPLIIEDLEKRNILFKKEKISHDYPFCWRCGTPLIYYAKPSWFIRTSKIKEQLIKNNQDINWIPKHIKDGRFGQWLENIKDWAISRERYWGTPLPIWECQNCNYRECVGSFRELEKRTGKKLGKSFDPHRPFVDKIIWKCPRCGGVMKRVPEVLDCWFDSGAMPYAQKHWPFGQARNWRSKNIKALIKKIAYPADFICEAIDQTRGWFYSLLAISTLLDLGPSYKNVICLGLVLDKNGQKMSKSKGNIIDPLEVIEKFGADTLRWYLYSVNQPGENKLFNLNDLIKIKQRVFLTIRNIFNFYKTYAFKKVKYSSASKNILDRWILVRLNFLIREVTDKMEKYDITGSARLIAEFIDDVSLWYLRRSRNRFKSKDSRAINTLGFVLFNLAKLLAPFTPFFSENLYLDLKHRKLSVHLENWPQFDKNKQDKNLLKSMKYVREICEIAHSLRAKAKIKVRQPLQKLEIKNLKLKTILGKDLLDLIKEEINVKEIVFDSSINKEVELDTKITPELKKEGFLREIVRQINSLRKQAGLTISQKADVYFESESREIIDLIVKNENVLKEKTLTRDFKQGKIGKNILNKEIKLDGCVLKIGLLNI